MNRAVCSLFVGMRLPEPVEMKMGKNIVEKILGTHLKEGKYIPGKEIGVKIDQTLAQDATGTMAFLQFEALGLKTVQTDLSVAYVDHNTVQIGYENNDDHVYLQGITQKFGVVYSRAGNGICHQVHLERIGKPGTTLLGSDSHTTTGGGDRADSHWGRRT